MGVDGCGGSVGVECEMEMRMRETGDCGAGSCGMRGWGGGGYIGGDNAGLLCFCRRWVKGGLCGRTWRLCVSIARTMGGVKRSAMVGRETMGSLFGETILCDANADADAAIYGVRTGWKGENWGRM